MSDPKIISVPGEPATIVSPDTSFLDDHVGALIKSDEAAKARIALDRFTIEQPRGIHQLFEKVEELAHFRPTQQDDAETHRAKRHGQDGKSEAPKRQSRRSIQERTTEKSDDLNQTERRLESLLTGMEELSAALPSNTQILQTQQAALADRLLKLEVQAKYTLQLLLAGGVGFNFLEDPRLAFKKIFDRLRKWPRRVRPGKRPETDDEFDDFLAWVFEPPSIPKPSEELGRW